MNYEEIICDANNLYKAYRASVKCSKWKETTQRFMMNYLTHIFEIQDSLLNKTLINGPVREFSISERGRIRSITSITPSDRIVRHVLCDEVLLPEVQKKLIYDNCASIKGKGISRQRERFEVHLQKYYRKYGNEGYILFGDFTKFYDNIIHEIASEYGIHINDKKTHIVKISGTYKFLQVKYTLAESGKIIKRINPDRVTAMRRKIKKLTSKVKTEEIPEEYLENMFCSWMGAHYKLMSKQQRKNLISLYEDLMDKNITIINKKLIISDK